MLSRTLGPEFGGSIGLIFFGGTVLNGAMSLLGFSETLVANFGASEGSVVRVLPDSPWYCHSINFLGQWSSTHLLF